MPYDERFITPMRQELTRLGVQELKTAEEVDQELADAKEPTLLVVNSMCGCAARNARPGIAMALEAAQKKPPKMTTVFAGQDLEATARAREYIHGYPPSSPSIALLKDGDVAYMMERHQIEGRTADAIARDLVTAFEQYC
ncbi:MAG TPA: BrxA/BrxB family bacilliredoxin [Longimicrobium sp.]|nr:BrxA/BrxB family bacilliredoxin [Longimicrobium sp.]